MKKKYKPEIDDMTECKKKIESLLSEYRCELISQDEWHGVLIRDLDTQKTDSIDRD